MSIFKGSKWKNLIGAGIVLSGIYAVMQHVAKEYTELENIDDDNPYVQKNKAGAGLKSGEVSAETEEGFYARHVKPVLDRILSFGGLVVLFPLYGAISLAIYIDDPGPVFFTQKRIGKDKHYIQIHKFRSMKMDTPHDVPTHQLSKPDQYITRVGRVLRRTSLDELPQLWDIFRGRMSIIGPRPALWNQDDLVAEREKYGANHVKPGLTGLAQVSGRDELEIPVKAEIDGKYAKALAGSGMAAFFMDFRCFFRTIKSVLGHEGIVEGGTGEGNHYSPVPAPEEAGFEDYGYLKTFHIDLTTSKKVLITGANSYVGESFKVWAIEHYPTLSIDTVDLMDGSWRNYDFSSYDTVFHVAGIAHADVGDADEAEKARYYAVNTDLAIETAKKAKDSGVKQFIFMSSMIVYGDSAPYAREKMIDEHTIPAPANFYGDSKWQADKGIRKLQESRFHVAVVRSPMIYGRNSKGNYQVLAKAAKYLPFFPAVRNQRSMIHIDNMCEFLCKLVMSGAGGIYFPQNDEYSNTSELVKEIAGAANKKIAVTKLLMPAVVIASHIPGKVSRLMNKAFGNSIYSQKISTYEGLEYQIVSLKKSVELTEDKKIVYGKCNS